MHPQFTIADDLMERTELAVPLVVGRCNWLEDAARQFQAIGRLSEGWDGGGASRPAASSLDAAWGLLVSLCSLGDFSKPHVNPTRAGGVQLEWESRDGYLEVEVAADQTVNFFFRDDQRHIEESGEIIADKPLDRVVDYTPAQPKP